MPVARLSPAHARLGRTPLRRLRGAWRQAPAVLALALLAGAMTPAAARGKDDHERARQAVQAGEVLPLSTVLQRLEAEVPGRVMEVELESDDGRWVYEIRLLQTDGRLVKVKVDARSGAVLRRRAR